MKKVVIECPFKGDTLKEFKQNAEYTAMCLKDSLERGEAPIAMKWMYSGVLNEANQEHLLMITKAQMIWATSATKVVIYDDLGVPPYMQAVIDICQETGTQVEHRSLGITRDDLTGVIPSGHP